MHKTEVKFLKIFVYFLGLVLMSGTLFLIYVVYKKNFQVDTNYHVQKSEECINFNIAVGGKLVEVQNQADAVRVLYRDTDGNYKLVSYNYCNGNIINEISVEQNKREDTNKSDSHDMNLQNEDVLS
ncbi:MAG: hypothetical protein ACK5WS_03790 [Alphaproteobacteria bacterium]|nr:hypothetical protein [Candidatus Jidaibacter sp.]